MATDAGDTHWPDPFVGGTLWLDFINTVSYLTPDTSQDRLADYSMVLRWSGARQSLAARTIAALSRRAKRDPRAASLAWRNCLALREELRGLLAKLRAGEEPGLVVSGLNEWIALLPPLARLGAATDRSRFNFDLPGRDLNEPIWPIVWSAAAVLASEYADRIGYCHAPPCRYVFLDLSRNQSRLWCDDGCGNRARVRRHQRRRNRRNRSHPNRRPESHTGEN